jgi:uncharacterized protein (DUF4415 family)
MKRYRLDPKNLRRLTPEEERRLATARIDYSDIPPLGDEFFTKAKETWPPAKQQLTIRLDADLLAWLKANGRGYQTRINRILRAAMESQPPRSTPPKKNTRSGAAHSSPRDRSEMGKDLRRWKMQDGGRRSMVKSYDPSRRGTAMTLTIKLTDEQAMKLQAKAAAEGLSLEQWLQKLAEDRQSGLPHENRTGADLIVALQSSPYRDIDIEPRRYRLPVRDVAL